MAQFKIYIQQLLEERISSMDDLGFDDDLSDDGEIKFIKIAQITFAFYNEEVINLLKKRGDFIKSEKWDKLDEINLTITETIKDPDNLNKLQTPCSIFATFESEEGYNRAIKYHQQVNEGILPRAYLKLLGKEFEMQPASEPTDIIWENRHFKPMDRTKKRVVVYLIILIMLAISGSCIFVCSSNSNALKTKYPKTKCEQVDKDFIRAGDPKKYKQLEGNAFQEFTSQHALALQNQKTHYTDILQCFCKEEKKLKVPVDKLYVNQYDAKDSKRICEIYFEDVKTGKFLGVCITLIIIIFNTILKLVIINAITWVGEDTYSERLASITNGVFVAQFFNTGLLLTLVNANITEHSPKFVTQFFSGEHYDYGPDWYDQVGSKITQTMLINAILPYVGLCTTILIPKVKQMMDNKDPYQTKKTSSAMFKALWSGGDYVIHFKYSGVLNIVYISCMYGIGMPILFPLAAFNFFNQWVAERIIMAWYMKQPPALDEKLTVNTISMLKFAPMLFLVNGFWILSNQQIFSNSWTFINVSGESMKSNHLFKFDLNWAAPVLIISIASVVIFTFQTFFANVLDKMGFNMSEKDIEVDEDLPNFFQSLKLSHADELILENINMMENFGFEHNDPDTIQVLDTTKVPVKSI